MFYLWTVKSMGRKERENEKLKEKRKKRQKRAEIFEMLLEISKKQEKNNITETKSSKDNKLHFLNKENIQKNKVKKSKVTGIDDKKSDITDKHRKKSEILDLNLKNKNQKKIFSDKIIFSSTEQTLSSSKKRITDDNMSEENSNNANKQEDSTLQRSITDDSNLIKNSNSIKKYFGVEDFQNTNSKTNIKDLNFFRKQYDEENKKLIEKIFKKVEFSSEESKNTFLNLRTNEIQDFRKTLPIFYEESQIVSNVKSNIITIIKGETGCGKTTQVAQFLYESGFSTNKKIGMTQPRRLAAISLSERINLEMNINICNYKIRYENTCNKNTKIKIMTDGILLKEIMKDFLLKDYSVIILDEIHERSINTDVLISLLIKIALYREKTEEKLKIIFMSATFDENIVFSLVEDILKKDKIEFENINSFISSIVIESRNYSVDIFYESTDPNNILESVLLRLKKILKMSL
ncbi:putative helicase, partial [Hamiltosporidium tvaerminnensis]